MGAAINHEHTVPKRPHGTNTQTAPKRCTVAISTQSQHSLSDSAACPLQNRLPVINSWGKRAVNMRDFQGKSKRWRSDCTFKHQWWYVHGARYDGCWSANQVSVWTTKLPAPRKVRQIFQNNVTKMVPRNKFHCISNNSTNVDSISVLQFCFHNIGRY